MTVIGKGVVLRGIDHESFSIPFNLKAGIDNDDVGKAVALDTSAANTVKLATNNDIVIGQLRVVEDRTIEGTLVGTVMMKGFFEFTVTADAVIPIGSSIAGTATAASAGEIKVATTANETSVVVESSANRAVVWLK